MPARCSTSAGGGVPLPSKTIFPEHLAPARSVTDTLFTSLSPTLMVAPPQSVGSDGRARIGALRGALELIIIIPPPPDISIVVVDDAERGAIVLGTRTICRL